MKNKSLLFKRTFSKDWLTLKGDIMKTTELSTCFCTNDVDACREY